MKKTLLVVLGLGLLIPASVPASAQAPRTEVPALTDRDRADIQALVTRYAAALATCAAEEYADLFAPVTGSFASGFRGDVIGRDKLIALVRSEPHCITPTPGRPVGNGPTVTVSSSPDGVTGRANLGDAGHYEDVYVKTPNGWRFQSRNVITKQEEAAGFTSKDFIELRRLAGEGQGYFEDVLRDTPVGKRLRSSGVVITVTPEGAAGKAYLRHDGGHYEDVYVRNSGGWRFRSRTYVPAAEGAQAAASR